MALCAICLGNGVVYVDPNVIGGPVMPCPECGGIQPTVSADLMPQDVPPADDADEIPPDV